MKKVPHQGEETKTLIDKMTRRNIIHPRDITEGGHLLSVVKRREERKKEEKEDGKGAPK